MTTCKTLKTCKTSANDISTWAESPTQIHMLYSVLPKQFSIHESKQFKKTKDFYRPQQCIWNNPHRTSDRLYKFYHKGMDQYKKNKEPQIKKQEQEQRQLNDLNRIFKLSQKREQTRYKFWSKKLKRIQNQEKIGIIRQNKTAIKNNFDTLNGPSLDQSFQRFQQITKQNHLLKRSHSEVQRDTLNRNSQNNQYAMFKKLKTKGQQKLNSSQSQKSYLSGLDNYDKNKQQTLDILKDSKFQMRNNIREDFGRQKSGNLSKESFMKQSFMKQNLLRKVNKNSNCANFLGSNKKYTEEKRMKNAFLKS